MTTTPASAASPKTRWEKIETAHFTVVFDSERRELGALYASLAEEAFEAVSPFFGLWPAKTVLLIDDSYDQANGMATGVPYPMIVSFPVLPTLLDSISDYGNWGLELVTHEYTHILNFEPATGWMRPLRAVFGSVIRPNMLLPRWYSEGLAVELETRLSNHGRLRSANYLAILRAMHLDGLLAREDISRINEVSIPDWPGGIRPYLMGAVLMNEATRLGGPELIKDLNLAYARRVPFMINGPVRERLGLDYSRLLAQAYQRIAERIDQQLLILKQGGQLDSSVVFAQGHFSHSPALSRDGQRLAIVGRDHNVDSFVTILARTPNGNFELDEKARIRLTGTAINRASWLNDGSALIHDGIDSFARYFEYSDLWRFDIDTRQTKRLTNGLRAREPVISPDGRLIVFVQMTAGSSRLASIGVDGTGLTVLYEPPLQTRISRPEFISDGRLVFSEKRTDGVERMKVLGLSKFDGSTLKAEGEPRTILANYIPAYFPRMSPEGLLFVSDRNGVANVYLADAALEGARALTNSKTRTLSPELDARTGDLYFAELKGDNTVIQKSPRSSWSQMPITAPSIDRLVEPHWPAWTRPQSRTPGAIEDYSPWSYLIPRYWLPFIYAAPGITYVSASTSASDPTGRHAYSLSGAYDSSTAAGNFFGSYINQTTDVPVSLSGASYAESVYGSKDPRRTSSWSAAGSFFLAEESADWKASLGWIQTQTSFASRAFNRAGIESTLQYSNIKMRGLEISPEKGGSFALGYVHYLPGMSDLEYGVTSLSLRRYLSGRWLPERHAVALAVDASFAPRLSSSAFGTTTAGGEYQSTPGFRGFVARGYASGVFLGRNLMIGSAEYRFPLLYDYRGYGTAPIFFKRWHGDVFVDAITLDGLVYDASVSRYFNSPFGHFFYGTGAEVKLDATIAYHVPVQFRFGLYYGADSRANRDGLIPFIGFGL